MALVPENLSTSALLQHFVPAPTHHRCKLCSPIPRTGSRDSGMGRCLILSESTSFPYYCRTKPWQCPTHDMLFPAFSWCPLLDERMEWVWVSQKNGPKAYFFICPSCVESPIAAFKVKRNLPGSVIIFCTLFQLRSFTRPFLSTWPTSTLLELKFSVQP